MKNSKKNEVYKIEYLTVDDFIKMRPYSGQQINGKPVIKQTRVDELVPVIKDALINPRSPVVISADGKINQANHRREACVKAIEKNILERDYVFPVLKMLQHEGANKASQNNFGGNLDHAKTNVRAHAISDKNLTISKKLYRPVNKAIKIACPSFPQGRANHLSMYLGAFFNNNPLYLNKLKNDFSSLDIYGSELYQCKTYNEAKTSKFFRSEAKVDLRGVEDILAKKIHLGLKFINELRKSGIWKEKLGNNSTLEYILLALSFRNELSSSKKNANKLTYNKLVTKIKNNTIAINNALKKEFANNPKSCEQTILTIFNSLL